MAILRRLLERANDWLLPGGAILLEIGSGQADEVREIACRLLPKARTQRFCDYAGQDRVVLVQM